MTYRTAAIIVAALGLAAPTGGCSPVMTASEIREDTFGEYRPVPVPRKIDAAVAIEVKASGGFSTVGAAHIEAMRGVLAEDLATLFTRPSLRRGGAEDFVLDVVMSHYDTWTTRVVEVTATLADPKGATVAAVRRHAEIAAAKGDPGPPELARIASGLKAGLLRRFEGDPTLAKHLGPASPVGPPPTAAPSVGTGRTPVVVPAVPYGASWALVVGINEYRNADPLNYAVNDARAVAAALPRLGFERVRLLVDGEATKAAIERVIYQEFQDRMGPDDRLFVFFAGHGITVTLPRGGEEGYLIPVDGDPRHPALSAIGMDEIRKMGRRVRAKHILFAIDSCFSGFALTRDITPEAARNVEVDAMLQEPVVQVLTAGRKGQKAVEDQGHGLFTRRLLDALRGLADQDRRGFVTTTQLAAWLGPRVARDSGGRQTPQYSALDGEGDFVFFLPRE